MGTRILDSMAMRAFTATRSLAAKAPAMHGSWGQTAVGGQHKTKLVKDWFQGASAFAKEHGVVEMARRFFIDKDIRYMLPYVKKVGEDQFGNEYFEDNGTVENPQMKTRQRIVRYGGANNVVFNLPVETSVIPPEWFAWMNAFPLQAKSFPHLLRTLSTSDLACLEQSRLSHTTISLSTGQIRPPKFLW